LISTVFQSITWRANKLPGATDSAKVVLCAPTGKSAFWIVGLTLHSVFSLPVNQTSGFLRPLSNDTLNSKHCKLIDIQLNIIDEISIVGSKMLGYLDQGLSQIFKSQDVSFGAKSIIVFADLKQLSPVGDRWIFAENASYPYNILAGANLCNNFKFFELTETMRQSDDHAFALALNNISEANMTHADIELFRTRVFPVTDVPTTQFTYSVLMLT